MFLDTDVVLAIVKKSDWLAKEIDISKLKSPVTSSLVVVEAELVIYREIGRKDVINLPDLIKNKIKIENFTREMILKGNELMSKYENLNIFDAFHVASCIVLKQDMVSTDHLFGRINEIKHIDPRNL